MCMERLRTISRIQDETPDFSIIMSVFTIQSPEQTALSPYHALKNACSQQKPVKPDPAQIAPITKRPGQSSSPGYEERWVARQLLALAWITV